MDRTRGRATINGRQCGGPKDDISQLRRENHFLRLELDNAHHYFKRRSRHASATVGKLNKQLMEANNEIDRLGKTGEAFLIENSTQTEDRDVTELFLQLQLAHQSLEQYVAQSHPFTENEEYLKGWRAILEVSVKLQQEQLHLMGRVVALAPCIDAGSHHTQWADVDELEQLNLRLQRLHVLLMEQAMMRTYPKKTCVPEQSQSSSEDDAQGGEMRDLELAPSITVLQSDYDDLEEKAARNLNDREDYVLQIQDLKVKLLEAEVKQLEKEAMAEELKVELFKVSSGVKNKQANRRDAGTMTADLDGPVPIGDVKTDPENDASTAAGSQQGAGAPVKPLGTPKSRRWFKMKQTMKKWKFVTRLKNFNLKISKSA